MNAQLRVERGDITEMRVDAIVNAVKESLLEGDGVDGLLYRAAGPKLREECLALGGVKTGKAKITKGYDLPAKHVIHTSVPEFAELEKNTAAILLMSCYWESLKLASEAGAKSIAFPSISSGISGYPIREAAAIAVITVRRYMTVRPNGIKEVIFAVFSEDDHDLYTDALATERLK